MGDIIIRGLRRGVWTWCFCSAASAAPAPFDTSAMLGTVTVLVGLALVEGHRKQALLNGLSALFGLGLYQLSLLLCRGWHPLSVVLVVFGGTQAYVLAVEVWAKMGFGSKMLWKQNKLIARMSASVWSRLVTDAPSQHPFVRYVLHTLGFTVKTAINVAIFVLWTFLDFRHDVVSPVRTKLRRYCLERRRRSSTSTLATTSQHRYQPLGQTSADASLDARPRIRLLKLLPRVPFGRLNCELLDVAVGEIPEYEAVSYTWGAGEFSGVIHIGGKPRPVSSTVEDLLYHRSSHFRSRFLWVDQICINQADNDEKARQIPLMRDIYRGAAKTIIWLDNVEDPWKARTMLAAVWNEFMYGTTESVLELLRDHAEQMPWLGWGLDEPF